MIQLRNSPIFVPQCTLKTLRTSTTNLSFKRSLNRENHKNRTVQIRNTNFQSTSQKYNNYCTLQLSNTNINDKISLNEQNSIDLVDQTEKDTKTTQNDTLQQNEKNNKGIGNKSFSNILFDLLHTIVKLGYNTITTYAKTQLPVMPIQFIAPLTTFLQIEGIISDYNLIKSIKNDKKKVFSEKTYLNFAIQLNFENYVQSATLVMLILHCLETHPKYKYFFEGYMIHIIVPPSMQRYFPLLQETLYHQRMFFCY
jgi:hypothetical protein